jgi:hypothetical protein
MTRMAKTNKTSVTIRRAILKLNMDAVRDFGRVAVYDYFMEAGEDGYDHWLYCNPGFMCRAMECGTIHEEKVKDVLAMLKDVAFYHDLDDRDRALLEYQAKIKRAPWDGNYMIMLNHALAAPEVTPDIILARAAQAKRFVVQDRVSMTVVAGMALFAARQI